MPLCGFNGKMLDGLRDFQEGLVEHGLYGRSRETGQTVEQRLQEELEDMKRFSKEVGNLKDPEMRDLVSGLSAFAGAFYRLARRKGLDGYKETAQGCVILRRPLLREREELIAETEAALAAT